MKALPLDHLIALAYALLTIWLIVSHPWELVEITVHGGVSGAYYLKARAERMGGPKP